MATVQAITQSGASDWPVPAPVPALAPILSLTADETALTAGSSTSFHVVGTPGRLYQLTIDSLGTFGAGLHSLEVTGSYDGEVYVLPSSGGASVLSLHDPVSGENLHILLMISPMLPSINANSSCQISNSVTLNSLTIGDGTEVTFGSGGSGVPECLVTPAPTAVSALSVLFASRVVRPALSLRLGTLAPSTQVALELKNTGLADLYIKSVALTVGTVLQVTRSSTAIAPGQSGALLIEAPSFDGDYSGTLTIRSNAPNLPVFTLRYTLKIDSGPPPSPSPEPSPSLAPPTDNESEISGGFLNITVDHEKVEATAAIDFGTKDPDVEYDAQRVVTLTNGGHLPVHYTSFTLPDGFLFGGWSKENLASPTPDGPSQTTFDFKLEPGEAVDIAILLDLKKPVGTYSGTAHFMASIDDPEGQHSPFTKDYSLGLTGVVREGIHVSFSSAQSAVPQGVGTATLELKLNRALQQDLLVRVIEDTCKGPLTYLGSQAGYDPTTVICEVVNPVVTFKAGATTATYQLKITDFRTNPSTGLSQYDQPVDFWIDRDPDYTIGVTDDHHKLIIQGFEPTNLCGIIEKRYPLFPPLSLIEVTSLPFCESQAHPEGPPIFYDYDRLHGARYPGRSLGAEYGMDSPRDSSTDPNFTYTERDGKVCSGPKIQFCKVPYNGGANFYAEYTQINPGAEPSPSPSPPPPPAPEKCFPEEGASKPSYSAVCLARRARMLGIRVASDAIPENAGLDDRSAAFLGDELAHFQNELATYIRHLKDPKRRAKAFRSSVANVLFLGLVSDSEKIKENWERRDLESSLEQLKSLLDFMVEQHQMLQSVATEIKGNLYRVLLQVYQAEGDKADYLTGAAETGRRVTITTSLIAASLVLPAVAPSLATGLTAAGLSRIGSIAAAGMIAGGAGGAGGAAGISVLTSAAKAHYEGELDKSFWENFSANFNSGWDQQVHDMKVYAVGGAVLGGVAGPLLTWIPKLQKLVKGLGYLGAGAGGTSAVLLGPTILKLNSLEAQLNAAIRDQDQAKILSVKSDIDWYVKALVSELALIAGGYGSKKIIQEIQAAESAEKEAVRAKAAVDEFLTNHILDPERADTVATGKLTVALGESIAAVMSDSLKSKLAANGFVLLNDGTEGTLEFLRTVGGHETRVLFLNQFAKEYGILLKSGKVPGAFAHAKIEGIPSAETHGIIGIKLDGRSDTELIQILNHELVHEFFKNSSLKRQVIQLTKDYKTATYMGGKTILDKARGMNLIEEVLAQVVYGPESGEACREVYRTVLQLLRGPDTPELLLRLDDQMAIAATALEGYGYKTQPIVDEAVNALLRIKSGAEDNILELLSGFTPIP